MLLFGSLQPILSIPFLSDTNYIMLLFLSKFCNDSPFHYPPKTNVVWPDLAPFALPTYLEALQPWFSPTYSFAPTTLISLLCLKKHASYFLHQLLSCNDHLAAIIMSNLASPSVCSNVIISMRHILISLFKLATIPPTSTPTVFILLYFSFFSSLF